MRCLNQLFVQQRGEVGFPTSARFNEKDFVTPREYWSGVVANGSQLRPTRSARVTFRTVCFLGTGTRPSPNSVRRLRPCSNYPLSWASWSLSTPHAPRSGQRIRILFHPEPERRQHPYKDPLGMVSEDRPQSLSRCESLFLLYQRSASTACPEPDLRGTNLEHRSCVRCSSRVKVAPLYNSRVWGANNACSFVEYCISNLGAGIVHNHYASSSPYSTLCLAQILRWFPKMRCAQSAMRGVPYLWCAWNVQGIWITLSICMQLKLRTLEYLAQKLTLSIVSLGFSLVENDLRDDVTPCPAGSLVVHTYSSISVFFPLHLSNLSRIFCCLLVLNWRDHAAKNKTSNSSTKR